MTVRIHMSIVLGVLLLILGVSQSVAFLLGAHEATLFARATAASPLPMPFRTIYGYEHFSTRSTVFITTADGERVSFEPDKQVLSSMRGPHKRAIVYMGAWSRLPIYNPVVVQPIIKKLLCTNEVLAFSEISPQDRVSIDIVSVQHARGSKDNSSSYHVDCD